MAHGQGSIYDRDMLPPGEDRIMDDRYLITMPHTLVEGGLSVVLRTLVAYHMGVQDPCDAEFDIHIRPEAEQLRFRGSFSTVYQLEPRLTRPSVRETATLGRLANLGEDERATWRTVRRSRRPPLVFSQSDEVAALNSLYTVLAELGRTCR